MFWAFPPDGDAAFEEDGNVPIVSHEIAIRLLATSSASTTKSTLS